MRSMVSSALCVVVLAVGGCKSNEVEADNTNNVSASCVDSRTALEELCPAGTVIDVFGTVGASGACSEDSAGADGGLAGICRMRGSCAVTCKVSLACECGAGLISKDKVECLPCQTCGNNEVEGIEQCDLGELNGTGQGCSKTCQTVAPSCSPNGDLRCSPDLKAVQVCSDDVWKTETKCTADEQCDPATRLCKTVEGYCANPGEERCSGAYDREICGQDHRWANQPCPQQAPRCSTLDGSVKCVPDEDAAVSANFRMPKKQFVIGGLYGYGESQAHKVKLGPVKK